MDCCSLCHTHTIDAGLDYGKETKDKSFITSTSTLKGKLNAERPLGALLSRHWSGTLFFMLDKRIFGCFLVFGFVTTLVSPVWSQTGLDEARRLRDAGDHKGAHTLYKNAVQGNPGDLDLRAEAAKVAGWAGDYKGAIAGYDVVLSSRPLDADARFGRALVISWTGDYDRAVEEFDIILAQVPNYLDVRAARARVLGWAKRFPEAEAECLRSLEVKPGDPQLERGLLDIYRWWGNGEKGAAAADRLLVRNPEDLSLLIFSGIFHRDRGDYKTAISRLEEALKIAPDRPDLRAQIGMLYAKDQKLDEAVNALRRSIEIDDGNVDNYVTLGRVLGYQQQIDESIKLYGKALERDPENTDAMIGLGRTYAYGRHWQESETAFQRAIEINPRNREAHEALAWWRGFSAPRVSWRQRYLSVRDRESERDSYEWANEGIYTHSFDPETGWHALAAWGTTGSHDRPSRSGVYLLDHWVFGAGGRTPLGYGLSARGRFELHRYNTHGLRSHNFEAVAFGSGFGLLEAEWGDHNPAFLASKEPFVITDSGDLTASIGSLTTYAISDEWDWHPAWSGFVQMGFSDSTVSPIASPFYELRLRHRRSWKGAWRFDYRLLTSFHALDRRHGPEIAYKNSFREKLQYEAVWTPTFAVDEASAIEHSLRGLMRYKWTPAFSSYLNGSRVLRIAGQRITLWNVQVGMEWRL